MKILHLEDNPTDAELVSEYLREEWPGCEIKVVRERPNFVTELQRTGGDLILSDFSLGSFTGLEALEIARQQAPTTPFIFFSGTIPEDVALSAVRDGASDYVLKERPKRLITAIRHALLKSEERKKRQEAEAAVRRSEERFRLLVNQAVDAMLVYDAAGNFREVNHQACASLGYTQEELLEKHMSEIDPEFTSAEAQAALEEARPGKSSTFYTHHRRKDGTSFPVEVRLGRFELEGEQLFLGLARDITERLAAETQIREQGNLLNQARDAIVLSDLEGLVVYWNKGAERLLGWSSSEAVGQRMNQFVTVPGLLPANTVHPALADDVWRGEIPALDRQGRELILEIHLTLVRDEIGRPKARLSIITDVTEKNRMKEQFFRAQRVESLGMLAAGIAHDLNNVLAPMLMIPPMLRERAVDPRDASMLDTLEKSAERGAGLVRQILGFAQGAAGQHCAMHVRQVLSDLKGLIAQTFPKSIVFEQSEEPNLWPILGCSTQIHQVLLNLCINARDAMPNGGTLRLHAKNIFLDSFSAKSIEGALPGSWLALEVEDAGTGIPPEVVKRLWDPFFTTKEPGKGTGLGLSTVRGIVQSHGGFITLATRPGRGTLFVVYLPAIQDAESGGNRERTSSSRPRGNGELVFVVDDEAAIRDLTTAAVGSSRVDLQACKLEYSIVSPK